MPWEGPACQPSAGPSDSATWGPPSATQVPLVPHSFPQCPLGPPSVLHRALQCHTGPSSATQDPQWHMGPLSATQVPSVPPRVPQCHSGSPSYELAKRSTPQMWWDWWRGLPKRPLCFPQEHLLFSPHSFVFPSGKLCQQLSPSLRSPCHPVTILCDSLDVRIVLLLTALWSRHTLPAC